MSGSSKTLQSTSNQPGEKMPKRSLVASSPGNNSHNAFKHMVPPKSLSLRRGPTADIAVFLLKVTALEVVRRISRARCPFIWRAVQALQVLGYPPLKWIQRWTPFGIVVEGVQKFSRPLLFLSIATAFSPENCKSTFDGVEDSQPHCESPRRPSSSDTRSCDESPEDIVSENWMVQLFRELEKKGITLPERINEDELHRFYSAANGDLSCLLSSLKRTIRWRETYNILTLQELEMWSRLVFWHGFDVMLRPCLVIRLGLACSSLVPHDRPRFAQAVVSQIEHGVVHLINEEDPRITVLMDCEGISPFRFPMQMMRSCTALLQEHYPNRLAMLFVVRLPPVVRVLAQTFIQVLKPTTRQKLRVEGEKTYQKVLSEFLQTLPEFLGGNCTCSNCRKLHATNLLAHTQETSKSLPCGHVSDDESASVAYPITEHSLSGNCDHVIRAAVITFLMLWIIIAFLAGMHDFDSFSSVPP